MPDGGSGDVLDLLRKAKASQDILAFHFTKGLTKDANSTWHQSSSAISGLTAYDLEAGAKWLVPDLTPLRNRIPRVSGKGGIQANWRAITQYNSSLLSAGVSGGNRGGVTLNTTQDKIAIYKGLGLESNVDFEAQYAGQTFDDLRAVATKTLLMSFMRQEETIILGGLTSYALTAPGTPNVSDVTSGGTFLANTTYYVKAVALTARGVASAGNVGGAGLGTGVVAAAQPTNIVLGLVTRTNADGSVDQYGGGSSAVSAEGSATTSNNASNTHSLSVSLTTPVTGAMGYAWFVGTTSGQERLCAISPTSAATLTTPPNASNQLVTTLSTDQSADALVFDGLLYQALAANSGAYQKVLSGTATLTSDGAGGIVEIDAMLLSMWQNARLGPTRLLMADQQAYDISKKILAGTTSAAQRFVIQTQQDAIKGGVMVRQYFNRFTMGAAQAVEIEIHPDMPQGTILALTDTLPYSLSNVTNVYQMKMRQEYYQIEWPLRSRKWEYGIYADGVLQHYFPPSMGVITNIAAG